MSRVTYICEYCNYAIPGAAELIAERDQLKADLKREREANAKLREALKMLHIFYCVEHCEDPDDIEPPDHDKRCINAQALLAAKQDEGNG